MAFLKKLDKSYLGVIFGSVLPILGFFISYLIKRHPLLSIQDYAKIAMNNTFEQTDVLTLCLIPNLVLFYFVNFRWEMNEFTKGLVAVTILLVVSIFILNI